MRSSSPRFSSTQSPIRTIIKYINQLQIEELSSVALTGHLSVNNECENNNNFEMAQLSPR